MFFCCFYSIMMMCLSETYWWILHPKMRRMIIAERLSVNDASRSEKQ